MIQIIFSIIIALVIFSWLKNFKSKVDRGEYLKKYMDRQNMKELNQVLKDIEKQKK